MPGASRPAGSAGKMPGASRNFVWKEDFSAPSSKPEAGNDRQASQNAGDFRPGLPAANKPGHRFKWDDLDSLDKTPEGQPAKDSGFKGWQQF